jgi:hypothetical protein
VLEVPGDAGAFDRAVEKALTEKYGYVREVISRSPEELEAALEAHPFEVIEPKYSYVAPLTGMPSVDAIARAKEVSTGDDRWEIVGTGGARCEQGAQAAGGSGDGSESEHDAGSGGDGVEGAIIVQAD